MLLGYKQVLRLEGHTGEVTGVAWSPSGDKLASASSDKAVTVLDSASAEQVIVTLNRDLPC